MEQFRYQPIDLQGRSFRLVQLFGAEFGPVRCEVFDARLDDQDGIMEYDALSYTWGDTYKPHEIELNGRVMSVTKNLSLALRDLRYPQQDRILWIDAICIDQTNDKERGQQVLQIPSIYMRAEQVIIWLGPATIETDLVFHCMSQFEKEAINHACKDWKASDERWLGIWDAVQPPSDDSETTSTSQLLQGFPDLLSRSWFDRVWVVPEVATARAARVTCGTKSVSARIFTLFPSLAGVKPSPHCQAILDIMPGATRKYSWWFENQDLHTLILKFRESKASDPRDKIYALLGTSSDGCNADVLVPDYEKSVAEIVQDTVAFLLRFHDVNLRSPHSLGWTMVEFLERLEHLGSEVFVWAAGSGSGAIVKLLLDTGKADINFKTKDDETSLLLAAKNGQEPTIKLLLGTRKVDVDFKNKVGETALLLAAENGHKTIVKQLLDAGADVDSIYRGFWTPLWAAAISGHEAIVEILLGRKETNALMPPQKEALKATKALAKELLKADKVESSYQSRSRSQTPLWWALYNGHTKLFKLFLETGSMDPHSLNQKGESLLFWAARNKRRTEFGLLLNMPDINLAGVWNILTWAAENGDDASINLLLYTGRVSEFFESLKGRELISRAACKGEQAVVKLLLDSGKSDDLGRGEALWKAAGLGNESIVKLLLDTGRADVNFKLRNKQTPLWRAAWGGKIAVVKLLLSIPDIEVDPKDDTFQQTPLSMAAEAGHAAVVELLLETNKVDVHTTDRNGQTPLALAKRKELAALGISSRGSDGEIPFRLARRHEVVKLLEVYKEQ